MPQYNFLQLASHPGDRRTQPAARHFDVEEQNTMTLAGRARCAGDRRQQQRLAPEARRQQGRGGSRGGTPAQLLLLLVQLLHLQQPASGQLLSRVPSDAIVLMALLPRSRLCCDKPGTPAPPHPAAAWWAWTDPKTGTGWYYNNGGWYGNHAPRVCDEYNGYTLAVFDTRTEQVDQEAAVRARTTISSGWLPPAALRLHPLRACTLQLYGRQREC